MSEVKRLLEERFGEHKVSDVPVKEGEMPLLVLDLEAKSNVTILVTNGLSDYKMPVPEKEKGLEYNELFFCLPSYWDLQDRDNPQMNWVFRWIQRLAKYVVDKETWFGNGHTMPCGAEMNSLSLTMKQNHFLLLNPILLEIEMAPIPVEGKTIQFLAIVPIFGDEMDYKQGKGTVKLLCKMLTKNITEKLDDFRGTSLKRNWKMRR